MDIDRNWLLTWTTYGTWLPGDKRGFVSKFVDESGTKVIHNRPETAYARDLPDLVSSASRLLKCDPTKLNWQHAELLQTQFEETANFRGWRLTASAIMANHIHMVVGVPGDPEPSSLLRDFKAYGARALNAQTSKSTKGNWWTESGSTRKLASEDDLLCAIQYVVEQEYSLLIWSVDVPELKIRRGRQQKGEPRA